MNRLTEEETLYAKQNISRFYFGTDADLTMPFDMNFLYAVWQKVCDSEFWNTDSKRMERIVFATEHGLSQGKDVETIMEYLGFVCNSLLAMQERAGQQPTE